MVDHRTLLGLRDDCPRKAEAYQNRKCFKKCRTDDDCKGPYRKCLCDDVCGKSCVKPKAGEREEEKPVHDLQLDDVEPASPMIPETSRLHALPEIQDCPRKPELIVNRKCYKKCQSDEECRGRNKQCLCDDVCGKSCVNPTRRCQPLKAVFNGRYEIVPFNTFGAKARYTCHSGYVLAGSPERVCQGDGYWSGQAPTCATEESFPALSGKCLDPPVVPHASHDGPPGQIAFQLGTQLTYTCQDGYNIDGFFRAMCIDEGRWVGPRMTCSPRPCPHPGDLANGRREGNIFIYPNRVTYVCSKGFELEGPSAYRMCQADGTWSGRMPKCKPVTCPRLTTPANGRIITEISSSSNQYNQNVTFACFRGFRLVGSRERRCRQDGRWSGNETKCRMVDCGLPVPFYNGFLEGGPLTTFGARISFRCMTKTTFVGVSREATCQENGKWTHPLPTCWSKCAVPIVANASINKVYPPPEPARGYERDRPQHQDYPMVGDLVDHESRIDFYCGQGHKINTTDTSRCYNGTWTFLPVCEPKACDTKRPDDVKYGMVRYHSVNHGDKAKYKCNTGYRLKGDTYLQCQYGVWTGQKPECEAKYCEYPGTIKNGQILLVGVIGKYEYRSYVRRIGHNEQIEYQCNKGYKRVGPQAATCVDGEWSPKTKPYCKAGQHPGTLYVFRGKRSIPDQKNVTWEEELSDGDEDVTSSSSHGSRVVVLPYENGGEYVELRPASDAAADDEVMSSDAETRQDGSDDDQLYCENPGRFEDGRVVLVGDTGKYEPREHVQRIGQDERIEYQCREGFILTEGPSMAKCVAGHWTPEQRPRCQLNPNSTVDHRSPEGQTNISYDFREHPQSELKVGKTKMKQLGEVSETSEYEETLLRDSEREHPTQTGSHHREDRGLQRHKRY